jgi:putative ATPase
VLNALELAIETTGPDENDRILIDLSVAEESIQQRAVLYDKEGDVHYDTVSAFIKSLRGSDPDAALYWMAKMIYAGEDPRFIFRRMAILAGEDVGMADPNAAGVVAGCWDLFDKVGMPEGRFHLAQAALYLATCPKSNSSLAFFDALTSVEREQEPEVPTHLRDASRDKEGFGHGKGYLYPHAYRDHWVAQQYLPEALQGKLFYEPSDQGYERGIREQVARRREAQLAAMVESDAVVPEILTTSPIDRARDAWLQRAIANSGRNLSRLRDSLFGLAQIQRHHLVLDLKAGSGLLTWEAMRQAPEGGVWALSASQETGEALRQQAGRLPELERPVVLVGTLQELPELMALRGEGEVRFDRILGRNAFSRQDGWLVVFEILAQLLGSGGRLCLAQVVPHHGQRLYELVDWTSGSTDLFERVREAEEGVYSDSSDNLVRWDVDDLLEELRAAGFDKTQVNVEQSREGRRITDRFLERWFGSDSPASADEPGTYAGRLAAAGLDPGQVERVAELFRGQLIGQVTSWSSTIAYVTARR